MEKTVTSPRNAMLMDAAMINLRARLKSAELLSVVPDFPVGRGIRFYPLFLEINHDK